MKMWRAFPAAHENSIATSRAGNLSDHDLLLILIIALIVIILIVVLR